MDQIDRKPRKKLQLSLLLDEYLGFYGDRPYSLDCLVSYQQAGNALSRQNQGHDPGR